MAVFDASGAQDGVYPADPGFTLALSIEVDVGSYLTVDAGTVEWLSSDGNTRILVNGTFTFSDGAPTGGEVTSITIDTSNDADDDVTITFPAGPRPDITDLIADTESFWIAALAQSDTFTLATTAHPDQNAGYSNTYFGDFYDLSSGETLIAAADSFTTPGALGMRFRIRGDGLDVDGNLTAGDDTLHIVAQPNPFSTFSGDVERVRFTGILIGGDDEITYDVVGGSALTTFTIYGEAIDNFGDITGGDDTLRGYYASANTIYGDVDRMLGGTLVGGDDIIEGGTFDILIGDVDDMNDGELTAGHDTIHGNNNDDEIYGDYRTFNGGTILSGGNDLLYGGHGNDEIYGNEGDDLLNGGRDDDTLDGGAGTDTADYSDTNAAEFVTVNLAAASDHAVGSELGESYSIDTDQLVNIENVIGSGQGDSITGDAGVNRLEGGGGGDFLDGGANADMLIGGTGDDVYIVDNAGDVVTEETGEGNDQIQTFLSLILPDNVENLALLDAGDINGVGNALANTLIGNGGNNILDGVGGADTMSGGSGDDTYVVDNAGDVVSEAVGQGTDQVNSSVGFTLFANLENLSLVGAADVDAIGNELDNNIFGNAGNNTLDGLTGADNMIGGDGDDIYVVDNVGDSVSDSPGASGGTDQVNSYVSFALFSYLENLSLLGSGDIDAVGNELDNVLIGNSGNNTLDGLAGADTMIGNAGDDIFLVDNAGDTVADLASGGGTDQVNSSVSFALVANIENLSLTGSADIDAVGNELDNVLIGNAGNNTLDGLTGADTMFGGAGDDIYVIDNAGDTANEGAGEGTDQVNSSVSFALFSNIENLSLLGSANLNATGNELGNNLFGNSGDNAITGNAGADLMIGNGGNDTYFFGDGSGVDIITDFSAGAGAGDVLYIVDFGFADFAAVLAAADDSGGTGPTVIQLDGDDSITLQGVVKADLAADDFILS